MFVDGQEISNNPEALNELTKRFNKIKAKNG